MKLIKTIIVVLVASAFVIGQTSVVNSSHNLSTSGPTDQASNDQTRVCIFCHTPHNGSVDVLWNRTNPLAGDFTVRTTATLQDGSLKCLSCHDGATAVNNLTNGSADFTTAIATNSVIGDDGFGNPVLIGSGDLGLDLTSDHPVGIDYPANGTAGFHNAVDLTLAQLIGTKVACASCHNPHDTQYGDFLIASNSGSALCLDCHDM